MNMTNVVQALAQSAANPINWTTVISILTICLTAMATIIKIFANKLSDDTLNSSKYISGIENATKENSKKIESMNNDMNKEKITTAKHASMLESNATSIKELKEDNREIVQRLDDLLKQLLEWISHFE